MTFMELVEFVEEKFGPNAIVAEDVLGEIVISTNLVLTGDDNLVPYDS